MKPTTSLLLLSALGFIGAAPLSADQRVFVLLDSGHIRQVNIDRKGGIEAGRTYGKDDFPEAFPAESLMMESGNILRTRGPGGRGLARLRYDPGADALTRYSGNPGDPASLQGAVLEKPDLGVNFRKNSPLERKYRDDSRAEALSRGEGRKYRAVFVLDGKFFGIEGSRIDRLDGAAGPAGTALAVPGAEFVAASVSPWDEAFLTDAAGRAVRRVRWRRDRLELNGTLSGAEHPSRSAFGRDGELYLLDRKDGRVRLLRYRFVLADFTDWREIPDRPLGLDAAGALDLAVSRPVGYVISEASNPMIALGEAGAHHRISQSIFVAPYVNSRMATIALVEYAPGGYTELHDHDAMEQAEIVVAGKALWEVGESERVVGPGDVIFCPEHVKHGYKVLGDSPFRYYQVEWRENPDD